VHRTVAFPGVSPKWGLYTGDLGNLQQRSQMGLGAQRMVTSTIDLAELCVGGYQDQGYHPLCPSPTRWPKLCRCDGGRVLVAPAVQVLRGFLVVQPVQVWLDLSCAGMCQGSLMLGVLEGDSCVYRAASTSTRTSLFEIYL
jgi:hypothetical protein